MQCRPAQEHHRVSAKHGLGFSEFDPKSPNLNLMVGTAKELDTPIGQMAGQIAGCGGVYSMAYGEHDCRPG